MIGGDLDFFCIVNKSYPDKTSWKVNPFKKDLAGDWMNCLTITIYHRQTSKTKDKSINIKKSLQCCNLLFLLLRNVLQLR